MSQPYTSSTILDDTSSNITYSGSWSRRWNLPGFYDGSDMWSNKAGDTATLNFYGTSVEYWGNQEYDLGPCRITVDGNVVATINGYAPVATGQPALLYQSNELALAEHVLAITVIPEPQTKICELDRFIIHTSIDVVAAAPTTPIVVPPTTASSSSPVSTATSRTSGLSTTATSITSGHLTTATSNHSIIVVLGSLTYAVSATPSKEAVPDTSPIPTRSTPRSSLSVIIGSVFAAASLILFIIFLLWLRIRRRRRRGEEKEPFRRLQSPDSESLAPAIAPGSPVTLQVTERARRAREVTSISSSVTSLARQQSIHSDSGTELHRPHMLDSTSNADATESVQGANNPASEVFTDDIGRDPPPAYHEA